MAAHIVTVIDQAKHEEASEVTSLGLMSYYQHSAGYAPWGNVLDLRDLVILESCETWDELLEVLTRMEEKYEKLWKLAGEPPSLEEWAKRLDYQKPNSVTHEYWTVYNSEVSYGKSVIESIQ